MAVLYVVAAWLIMQVAEVLIALAKLPDWIGPTTLMLLAIGFPIAVIVSWFYEITPEGISLEKDVESGESITHVTGRRLDFLVISLLCAAVILFAYDKWWIPAPTEQSIAVLAFENMSGDPEQEYFSDGISEELLNLLAQIPELTVISRSSAFSFKGKVVSVPEVARQLNVAHVLEGSVRKMGNRVRITAQLIEARSDSHLWSDSYDRELDDIFAVQGEIAAAISDALRVKLLLGAGAAVQPNVIKAANIDAYDAYLKGRYHFNRVGEDGFRLAIGYFEEAVSLDSTFALAYAGLADVCLAPLNLVRKDARSLDDCEEFALMSVELDDQLAEAHAALGVIRALQWDWAEAEAQFKRAIDLNPNSVMARRMYFRLLMTTMRLDAAQREIRKAEELDPLNLLVKTMVSWPLFNQHRYEEALAQLDEVLQMDPDFGLALYNKGYFYMVVGMPDEVLTYARLAAKRMGEDAPHIRLLTASGHALKGDEEKALEILADVERDHVKLYSFISKVYLLLGQEEAAFVWLEKGLEIRSWGLPGNTSDSWFDDLRDHPRFKAMRREMGLP
jgi:serine/threonine-protein kinase